MTKLLLPRSYDSFFLIFADLCGPFLYPGMRFRDVIEQYLII